MPITSLDPQPRSYAQGALVTRADRTLFISGQVPEVPDGTVPDDFDSQCRLAWRNVLTVLKDAGMTECNLVKVSGQLRGTLPHRIGLPCRCRYSSGVSPAHAAPGGGPTG